MREFVVIGGGMGGCAAAALLNAEGRDVVLLEKEGYLGGCASTFTRGGRLYNAGATTVSGYGAHESVGGLFEKVGAYPKIIETDPAIVVLQEGKKIRRFRDMDRFLGDIQKAYPHPKHEEFWRKIAKTRKEFYETKGYYYQASSTLKKSLSLLSFAPLFAKFFPLSAISAKRWIESYYGKLTPQYEDFLNAQIFIVAQAPMDKVSALVAVLSLGYSFGHTHYAVGGMGAMCDALVSKTPDVRKNAEVSSIVKTNDGFAVTTKNEILETKNIILGTSIFENVEFFYDKRIRGYFDSYKNLNNRQSAFVVYISLKSDKKFYHHYQLIAKERIAHTISKAIFVSFSDPADHILANKGEYSVTASIHVDANEWTGLGKSGYYEKKLALHTLLLEWICESLDIAEGEILDSFAATPKTFHKYVKRVQLGGNAMSLANPIYRLPSNDAPIKGLYQVGDTVYPAQGWPGVVAGVENMIKNIRY